MQVAFEQLRTTSGGLWLHRGRPVFATRIDCRVDFVTLHGRTVQWGNIPASLWDAAFNRRHLARALVIRRRRDPGFGLDTIEIGFSNYRLVGEVLSA